MSTERQWISVSDMMAVLMMVFLFISIVFMLKIQEEQRQISNEHNLMKAIAQAHADTQADMRHQLQRAFTEELQTWDASVLSNGAVRFSRPESLFAVGSSQLTPAFKKDLKTFFPEYIELLSNSEWKDEIEEIRIEGHTSSDWKGNSQDSQKRYLDNARLSQERAFAVLEYVYGLPEVAPHRGWLKRVLRATGASYSQPALVDGIEDPTRSRRVEFHARVRSDETLGHLLNSLSQNRQS